MQSEISHLSQEAQTRWLKPVEVLFILQNYEEHQITHQIPQTPPSGSLHLFDKREHKFFRRDGHSWRRRRHQNAIAEAHERLKVGNVEALNCCYAHGEENRRFQRRIYWILDPKYEHIVLVHYRYASEGRQKARSSSQISPLSSSIVSHSPNSFATQQPESSFIFCELNELHHDQSSLGSGEISSREVFMNQRMNHMEVRDFVDEANSSSSPELHQALQLLERQLNSDDDEAKERNTFYIEDEESFGLEDFLFSHDLSGDRSSDSNYYHCLQQCPVDGIQQQHFSGVDVNNWEDMLDNSISISDVESGAQLGRHDATTSSVTLPFEVDSVEHLVHSPRLNSYGIKTNSFVTHYNQGDIVMSLEDNINVKQKFTIQEISPAWCYSSENAKIIIIGSFLCDPSEVDWACMFGNIEVPIQIIRPGGIICCYAPPNLQGKVSLSITSGNRESCSEIKEFEYRSEPSVCSHSIPFEREDFKSSEELLLLVEFVQILLSDLSPTGSVSETRVNPLAKPETSEDVWSKVMDSILIGASTSFTTLYWILQQVLKDKLSVSCTKQKGCYLSKKGRGILHMVGGMGFEWALQPILDSGASVNFRDINGWTALHWAAKFGREKMVAALIASGASAGAITDPSSQDPTGKTAAAIATACGHRGIASYLSEVALTSHLSSLVLEEYEISKGSAALEAEKMVNSLSMPSPSTSENEGSLEYALAAARVAVEAAARIQSAFRAHSFRKRQQRETSRARMNVNDCSISENDIPELSAALKLAFGKGCDNSAALSIQKNFRSWKGRKDYCSVRKKVVKIQAHVRGYQVRKKYNVRWAVSILEKVILRWRRHGVGFRGFRVDSDLIDESSMSSEDEDIIRVFRKQNVEAAIDEAVSAVLSMVKCPTTRQQYGRIFAEYRLAKGPTQQAVDSRHSRCVMSSYHAFSFVENN